MPLLWIFVYLMGDFVVYNATKHLAEVLSSVPECEKAAMCLAEEGHVFDKLRSGTCDSAVDHEFGVKESRVWYLQKHKEEVHQNVCEAAPSF